MKKLKKLTHLFIFVFLTVLTQVGGIIYIVSFLSHSFIEKRVTTRIYQRVLKCITFIILYLTVSFLLIPILAKPFGRVPLPLTKTNHLRPLTFLTCLLNRHYVRPELKEASMNVANEMHATFPTTVINYLDANFPFINNFPLFPHLSHNDGKKLDLAFCYKESSSDKATNDCPSAIGYGICEEPLPNETNTAAFCAEKGYWNYSLLTYIIPQGNKKSFKLDHQRTKKLVNLLTDEKSIGKLFIEPHLVRRLNLHSEKIRFHGCQAVRHDDHIHIQLK